MLLAAPVAVLGAPLLLPPSAAAAQGAPAQWVQNHRVAELWSGPDQGAEQFGLLRQFSFLRVERIAGSRLYVFNPRSANFAYIDASAVGPSGPPPDEYLEPVKVVAELKLPGRLLGKTELYAEPVADEAVWVGTLSHNHPVMVEAQVKGTGGNWFRLESGEFVSGDSLRLPRQVPARYAGRWIDGDLNDPVMVTAYEGGRAVASTLAIKGVGRWLTPTGTFSILRRVPNETMSSDGLGIPRNAPGGYYVKDVLFTQYFTGDGAALHYNYWSGNFGYAGSHGCLGMTYDDSLWFWHWANVGTPVVVSY
jgi:lipoprotein-anchoring transpeptidase ErfK/SrfK